jgi:hypothetical protein
MTPHQLAVLIPAQYRKEILLTNMISKAQAVAGDVSMYYLFTVWKNYVEPTVSESCNLCYARVLESYKWLQDVFVQLEKEENLLNAGI